MEVRIFNYITIVFVLCLIVVAPSVVFASSTNGTVSGYAWGDNIGWVNFGCDYCSVSITDSVLTGYAWSANYGWINLGATQSGVVNNAEGSLSAKAWGEQLGWINFSGVTVNSAGVFSGTASIDEGGSISFSCTNCTVTTDWRPASTRSSSVSSGSGVGGRGVIYGPPSGIQKITINNGGAYASSRATVLHLDGGPDAVSMVISNNSDFSGAIKESFLKIKPWDLLPGDGVKSVYAKYYTKYDISSQVISAGVILDTMAPSISIISLQDEHSASQSVVVGGTTERLAEVMMVIDDQYGSFRADSQGNWLIALGIMTPGSHHIEFTARDLADNIGQTIRADFIVTGLTNAEPPPLLFFPNILVPPLEPILRKLEEGLKSFLPNFFEPIEKIPQPVVVIPKITPVAFKGIFHYISSVSLSRFALAPLPDDIKLFAQQLPKVQKTFNSIGIQKITDVQKLALINLKLPNLTQTLLPEASTAVGTLPPWKGISVANLSMAEKNNIPSSIIFAKAAGGLVDVNVALSVNNKGKALQTINTIVGQSIQLVIRPDHPVKKVLGYMIFKSKKYRRGTSFLSVDVLAASLLFSNPSFLNNVAPNSVVSIEGSNLALVEPSLEATVLPLSSSNNIVSSDKVETRLVISAFEYQDSGGNVFVATVNAPVVDGEYEIITVMQYLDANIASKEIKLITVVDPEGYVYEKNGSLETRVAGSIISLYWLNSKNDKYELWPASEFQQENPQITDVRGTYSFLVPNGYYYIKVEAPGYTGYDGKPFEVKEGSGVHINIELKTKYWLVKVFDWKTTLLAIVVILLLYKFYRDNMRKK